MGQALTTSGSGDLPVTAGREICKTATWTLLDGEDTVTSKPVSIFAMDQASDRAQNFFRRAKTIRFPTIITVLHAVAVEAKKMIYVVTERVEPLINVLNDLEKDSVLLGCWQIARAVAFLNKDCNLVHGNINVESIFVNSSGDWKLAGFEFCSPGDDFRAVRDAALTRATKNLQWPPELQSSQEQLVAPQIDAWLLGVFIWSCFNPNIHQSQQPFERAFLKDVGQLPAAFKEEYSKLLSANPQRRLTADRLLECPCFATNPLIQTVAFLESSAIRDNSEKEAFYNRLMKQITSKVLPVVALRSKILQQICSLVEFSKEGTAIPVVGLICEVALDTPTNSERQIIQSMLIRLIQSGDRALRVALFQIPSTQLQKMLECVDASRMSVDLWPAFTGGFTDAAAPVRELSVKALVSLAPKLSPAIINGDMLKFLARLQLDEQPNIRTNTTIALGKLAPYLTDQTKAKVLLPAFMRALRDPFPPARRAALTALAATNEFYTVQDCALRIITAVAPSTLEPDPSIRRVAVTVLENCITSISNAQLQLDQVWQNQLQSKPDSPHSSSTEGVLGWASKWLPAVEQKPERPPLNENQHTKQQLPKAETHQHVSSASTPRPTAITDMTSASRKNSLPSVKPTSDGAFGWDNDAWEDAPQNPKTASNWEDGENGEGWGDDFDFEPTTQKTRIEEKYSDNW